jgi:hypothetical protein
MLENFCAKVGVFLRIFQFVEKKIIFFFAVQKIIVNLPFLFRDTPFNKIVILNSLII